MTFGNVVTSGRFTITSAYSDPLKLWMTNTPRKPDSFSRTGNAGFHASFHFTAQDGSEFFDDNVDLAGSYTIDFRWTPWMSGRRIHFTKLAFDLKKPE